MAIIEKRQLFRISDDIRISHNRLMDEDVNDAITQLSTAKARKSLFPKIKPEQEPMRANITIFGASFFSRESLIEGTHVSLAIKLNDTSSSLYAVGEVAYCKYDPKELSYKLGVKFKYLSKPDMQKLEDYLVNKLQRGVSEHLAAKKVKDEEAWLFDRDMESK